MKFKILAYGTGYVDQRRPEFEEYLKASPNDWWCRTGDLLKKEHRELYWRQIY